MQEQVLVGFSAGLEQQQLLTRLCLRGLKEEEGEMREAPIIVVNSILVFGDGKVIEGVCVCVCVCL